MNRQVRAAKEPQRIVFVMAKATVLPVPSGEIAPVEPPLKA